MHLKPTADNTIVLKSPREIAIMREAGRVVAETIRVLEEQAEAGMTTRDLDQIAARMFKEAGAESTALGYFGYPGHICVSVNDEVVHGIPGPRKLKRGDLVKVDVAARYRGYVGDSTHCFAIGGLDTLPERARELVQVTQEALFEGIGQARRGNRGAREGARHERGARLRRPRRGTQHARGPPGPAPRAARPRPGPSGWHGHRHRAPGQSRLRRREDARGRLDGRHRRRFTQRPLRAHRRHHRRWPRHPYSPRRRLTKEDLEVESLRAFSPRGQPPGPHGRGSKLRD